MPLQSGPAGASRHRRKSRATPAAGAGTPTGAAAVADRLQTGASPCGVSRYERSETTHRCRTTAESLLGSPPIGAVLLRRQRSARSAAPAGGGGGAAGAGPGQGRAGWQGGSSPARLLKILCDPHTPNSPPRICRGGGWFRMRRIWPWGCYEPAVQVEMASRARMMEA